MMQPRENKGFEHDELEEIRKLLRENLVVARETRQYARSVHRWQKLARLWTIFYWTALILLAVVGSYYAFPYLKTARDEIGGFLDQITIFTNNAPVDESQQ